MPFCPACRASLSYRRVPSVMPAGCQREARVLLCCSFICVGMGRSHGFPIENVGNDRRGIEGVGHDGRPALPVCHARRASSVISAGCQRESRVLLCCSFCLCGHGGRLGFPIENVGNDRRGIGMTEGLLCLFVMPAGSPLSCPPVSPITNVGDKVSGKPGSCFVVPFICVGMGESHGFPITNVGNDRGGLPTLDRNRQGQALGMTEGGIEGVGHDGRPALPVCHA